MAKLVKIIYVRMPVGGWYGERGLEVVDDGGFHIPAVKITTDPTDNLICHMLVVDIARIPPLCNEIFDQLQSHLGFARSQRRVVTYQEYFPNLNQCIRCIFLDIVVIGGCVGAKVKSDREHPEPCCDPSHEMPSGLCFRLSYRKKYDKCGGVLCRCAEIMKGTFGHRGPVGTC